MTFRMEGSPTLKVPHQLVSSQIERLTNDTLAQIGQLPDKGELIRARRQSDRNRTITICMVGLIAVSSLIIASIMLPRIARIETSTAINTGSIEALQIARNDLRASGVPERELPKAISLDTEKPVDVDALIQATTATVLAKIRTDPQYRGATGIDGAPGPIGRTGIAAPTPATTRFEDKGTCNFVVVWSDGTETRASTNAIMCM